MKIFYLVFFLLISSCTVLASEKKGISIADLHASDRVNALNVSWYYTWKVKPINGISIKKFVPMIWGGEKRIDAQIADLASIGKFPNLLLINEPNKVDQANMSVDEVIRRWPELQVLADRVSSPAPAGLLGPWFDRFYRIAKNKGLKFDFMAVHYYGSPDPKKFLDKIDAVYEKYQMPIWITEFAVADWDAKDKPGTNRYSDEEVLDFMKSVLPELERRPFVERYAWFGAGKKSLGSEQLRTSSLFNKKGDLTELGKYYAHFE